jgi:hypothetical protein
MLGLFAVVATRSATTSFNGEQVQVSELRPSPYANVRRRRHERWIGDVEALRRASVVDVTSPQYNPDMVIA